MTTTQAKYITVEEETRKTGCYRYSCKYSKYMYYYVDGKQRSKTLSDVITTPISCPDQAGVFVYDSCESNQHNEWYSSYEYFNNNGEDVWPKGTITCSSNGSVVDTYTDGTVGSNMLKKGDSWNVTCSTSGTDSRLSVEVGDSCLRI